MNKFFKKLFCRHSYEMIDGTCHMIHGGLSKGAFLNVVNVEKKYIQIYSLEE